MSAPRQVAVIDVGSNSIRLVIYRVEGRAIWTLHNEKVLAGLGRNLPKTGRLSREGARDALGALRRFRAVLEGVRPEEVFTAATAAVREAGDREAFLSQVREETGFDLRVLTGADEARLAAYGVLAGTQNAEGIVGDLGGSSLELVRLAGEEPERGITLPLGPFALQLPKVFDPEAVSLACDAVIKPHAAAFQTRSFHAVGGAWRNLALVHMTISSYPLQVVHQYEIPAAEAAEVCRLVARQSKSSLERIPGLSKKRAETLPAAAVVLSRLIENLGIERVSMSAFGVREGLIFEAMSPEVRASDPLIEGAATLGGRDRREDAFAVALEAWLRPLFTSLSPAFPGPRTGVILAAACRLSSLGAHLHPDHRADLAFDIVLRAPIPGQTHPERAFLAISVFNRYTAVGSNPAPEAVARLLSPDQKQQARALGAAMRLGCDLSGRSPVLLSTSRLALRGGEVVLAVLRSSADMVLGEQSSKRANQLGAALGVPARVEIVDDL